MQNNQMPLNNINARNAMRTSLALQVFLHRSLALPMPTYSIQYCTLMCNYDDSVPTSARGCRLGPTGNSNYTARGVRGSIGFFILQTGKCRVSGGKSPGHYWTTFCRRTPLPKGSFPTMITHGKIPLQVRWWLLLLLSHNSLW